ncbi:ATP-dependent endonuclease [Candidatus Gracilibacteria bacterium]|nr:ATP-dependent endonuclease [Candidatus Gracilibacteria bacterium]
MKLKKLTIKNFRGLKGDKNIIDFSTSEIIFLLGQNNIGKSSFLRAYEFFVDSKQKSLITDFYNHDVGIPIEIEAEFIVEGLESEPNWVNNWSDSNHIVKIKKVWSALERECVKYTWNPQSTENKKWETGGFGGFDSFITKYAPTPISINAMETEDSLEEKVNKMINDDFLKSAKSNYTVEYTAAETAIKNLQNAVIGSSEIASKNTAINSHFQKIFPTLELEIRAKNEEIKLVDSLKKNHSVNVKKAGSTGGREETFRQNGHGIIRQALFNFLAFLKEISAPESGKKEYIILFEEPELFLHPKVAYALRKSLYELVGNSSYQILCASHSPLMIDISKPKSSLVRVCKYVDDITETFQVGDELFQKNDEQKKMVQMINRFNSNICEAFYADKVILVEGDTEAIIFRDLLERFYPQEEIYVLNTGSKNNIPFFQEALCHFKIKHFIIHDTDIEEKTSAWTLNRKIWEKIETRISRRYVFKDTFEVAHSYSYNTSKGKPLSAYEYAQGIQSIEEDKDCVKFLKDICSDSPSINHTQEYIEGLFF